MYNYLKHMKFLTGFIIFQGLNKWTKNLCFENLKSKKIWFYSKELMIFLFELIDELKEILEHKWFE